MPQEVHFMRIAILGAGALGTVAGAYLSRKNLNPVLIDTNRAHVESLNQKGATIVGFDEFTTPVTAILPEQMQGFYDLVLYFVKQTHNEAALAPLLDHLHEDSVVCTLQNGIPEPAVAAIVGERRTVGATVGWPATFEGPGTSRLNIPPALMKFEIGGLEKTRPGAVAEAAGVLRQICATDEHRDTLDFRWTKLWVNAVFSGMSALCGETYGGVVDDPLGMRVSMFLSNEIIRIARAADITLTFAPGGGHIPSAEFFSEADLPAKQMVVRTYLNPARNTLASMLQDLRRGERTEVDWINGAVVEKGLAIGQPAPLNARLVQMIHEIESGSRQPSLDNCAAFDLPEIPPFNR
jgi:2-dehydropantoate 2-reductase